MTPPGILLRFEGAARGVCSISQVSAGRKNWLDWEVDGSTSAVAWGAENPEYLWIGHRGRPNELLNKDASLMTEAGADATAYPAGHVEGYPDTFRALFAAVYRDIDAGKPSPDPLYPTFADGHDAVCVTEAIARSALEGGWANVRR